MSAERRNGRGKLRVVGADELAARRARERQKAAKKAERERIVAAAVAEKARHAAEKKAALEEEKKRAAAKKDAEKRRIAREKSERERLDAERKAQRERINSERDKLRAKRREERKARRKKLLAVVKAKCANRKSGFGYDNKGFLPRVELTVRGDGGEIAKRFAAGGVGLCDMVKNGGEVSFKIRKKDCRKAIAILDGMCYNFKTGATFGLPRLFAYMLARIGLSVGAVAAALCMYLSYSYIWRVEISGNDKISTEAVESALAAAGFRSGLKKSALDERAATAAVNTLDGIADASAEVRGTTLYVYVLEAKDYSTPGKPDSYVSAYDATVTRIVMRSGTATVKRGDVVKAGDVLADGSVYSTAGELLYVGECDGEVYGNVSMTFRAEISTTEIEYRRTGRSTVRTCASLFGLKMFKSSSPYRSYETVASTANYDILLPLYVTRYEYFETEPVMTERDPDAAAKAFAASKIDEFEFTEKGLVATYEIKPAVSGLYTVDLFLSGEAKISRGMSRS